MQLIRTALEECTSCNSKNGLVKSQSGFNTRFKGQDGFTYDDGKGVKDSVILTGPLSEVYTKALNITLRKTPLNKPEEDTPSLDLELNQDIEESSRKALGTEALKEEDDTMTVLTLLKDKLSKETASETEENFEFTTLASDPSNVVANIAVMTASDAIKPEVIDKVNDYRTSHTNQDTILVVTVPTNGGEAGTVVREKLINLNPKSDVLGDNSTELQQAFESLYVANGIKVFYGVEGFMEAVKYIGRKL